ncbi:NAD(P)/FAD-dependent oxidoreductase [Salmonirosea aquatica]|uniref:FAD-dependent oxidoreductase n=1 Tax=Salmonirosea aquatica TaxID=2654236 RepID=A0A7C9F2L3_9BACT|nr:FAD-dependent oxidoreductase [Cytophagaceae bacterium SJW1-29]
MNSRKYDYILVGQGIGGTALAWHLIEAGKRVLVVNDSSRPSATSVAAGIYNPLTGRKLVKTWMADIIFPYAAHFYTQLEGTLHSRFVYPLPIYRPYRSLEERNSFLTYASESGVAEYIAKDSDSHSDIPGLRAPLGGLVVKGGGWIDLTSVVNRSRSFFIENNQYIDCDFFSIKLTINDSNVSWGEYEAGKIIFCQGVDARENTLFDWLPFNPVKGQILDVLFDKYSAEEIVNQGIFILPSPDRQTYRVGATYSWHDLDWATTDDGREYLEDRLRPLVTDQYTVLAQRAGLRPSSKDRRPFIGLHPVHPTIGIFNGLGTKGVTLAPYFANEFVQYLENDKELNSEVNIDRHFSLYYR